MTTKTEKKKKKKKLRFYYQSLEKKCILDLCNVKIHFHCHPELIPLWKKLQLFTLSSFYFVNISFVEGLYHVQGSKDE
jgi:hypothetical protein